MQFLRKHIVFRYFWVLMAIHILNCSIDTPDALPDYIAEDLSYNDIETFSELVLEQFMGFEDAIPEHDEQDNADGLSFEVAKILLYFQPSLLFSLSNTLNCTLVAVSICNYQDIYHTQFHPEIVSPPPQKA